MGMLPTVVATLLADTKEYQAKMDESIAKMDKLGAASKTTSEKMAAFGSKAATAVVGLGAALGVYAVDQAYKFQEQLDHIRNQAGVSAAEVTSLGKAILSISTSTGVTTTDLTAAGLAMEQAGIRGKAGQQLLLDASKAQVIVGGNVVDITKSIIAAQTLQLAKGMSINNLTGLLVAGSQKMVGGMQAESSMLSGRVGVALAAVGLKMKDVIAAGAEFSRVGLNSRAVTSFATGLSKLNLPLDTVHVTAKKTYTTLSTYALSLQAVGLSQSKLATDLRVGGVASLLTDIKDAAGSSTPKLQELLHVVFGTGAGTSLVLVNHLKDFAATTKSLSGAGGASLFAGFKEAIKQLGPQFKLLMAQVKVLMINAGKLLLPAVTDIAHWANLFFSEMKKHPLLKDMLGVGAGAVFGTAVAVKITQGISSVMKLINGGTQTDLLTVIARNTTVMAGEGATGGGGGILAGAASMGSRILGLIGSSAAGAAAVAGAGAYSIWSVARNPGQLLNDPSSRLWNNLLHSTDSGSQGSRHQAYMAGLSPGRSNHHSPGESSIHHRVTVRVTR